MLLENDPINAIVTGVGGQGNVLASQIIGHMVIQKGFMITIGETYGVSQRGGSVMSHLRISHNERFSPLIPEGMCHFVVGLEPTEALRVLGTYGNPEILLLVNTRPIYPIDVISGDSTYPEVKVVLNKIKDLSRKVWILNATEIALEMGQSIYSNMVMLGALNAINALPLDRDAFQTAISEIFPTSRLDLNFKAFDRGGEAVREL